jgi:hypothetical protein
MEPKTNNKTTSNARIGIPLFKTVNQNRRGRTKRATFEQLIRLGLAVEKTMTGAQQENLLRGARV